MTYRTKTGWLRGVALCALMIAGSASAAPFGAVGSFDGRIGASGPDRGAIVAGGQAQIDARGLTPGQSIILRQNGEELPGSPFAVDAKGELKIAFAIPETAAPGVYPVVLEAGGNAPFAMIVDVKVSKEVAPMGEDAYDTATAKIVSSPYQVAVGQSGVFVTGAVGRPPVKESELAKLDPETLDILARITPAEAPAGKDGRETGVFAVYGVGLAEELGQVWVTNTRQNTVAVYSAEDLSLIKQFPPEAVAHPRDALYADGKVYVSATFAPKVHVFDAKSMEQVSVIELESKRRGGTFSAASLSLAPEAGKLFVSSLNTNEVAVIDTATGTQSGGFTVDGSTSTIGLAATPDGSRVYTVAQGNDTVSIMDAAAGKVLKQVNVGANPLNAVVEPETGNVYIALRGGHAVVVMSPEGEVLANLGIGSTPNHLAQDGKGHVYVVNKSAGPNDPTADQLTRISAK